MYFTDGTKSVLARPRARTETDVKTAEDLDESTKIPVVEYAAIITVLHSYLYKQTSG